MDRLCNGWALQCFNPPAVTNDVVDRSTSKVPPDEDIHASSSVMQRDNGVHRAPQAQKKRQNCEGNLSESSATLLEPQIATESRLSVGSWVCLPENQLCEHSACPSQYHHLPPRDGGSFLLS